MRAIGDRPAAPPDELVVLACPNCGGQCVHHDRVDIYERSEDSNGLHVRVMGCDARPQRQPVVSVDHVLDENPSDRRQGVSIRFWCEGCSLRFTLDLAQHKGQTVIASRVEP